MEDLKKELQKCGLTDQQVMQVFSAINSWTNTHYPVMGKVVENILKKNHLIEYPV